MTPAHTTARLAELVCSNSLGSNIVDRAGGLLKEEARRLGSLLMSVADATALPAGGALAVDRNEFAERVTQALEAHPLIEVVREEVTTIPQGAAVIASGPLTSESLAEAIRELAGFEHLYFYDALAPIVTAESIDMSIAFRQSRYDRGQKEEGDYINCPLDEAQYRAFVDALLEAQTIELRDFEREDEHFFESCLPVEVLASRGPDALAFGPMRPVGLTDPRTGSRPFAVVQLRRDNAAGTLYNLVGFQTNLRWSEQRRVLRMIPGLERAEFVRLGQMHRNTYINSPRLLGPTLGMRQRPQLFFAGQITGIEGYAGNAASGLLAGVNAARHVLGRQAVVMPPTTMLGALCRYVSEADPKHFQPMKANMGLLPPLASRVRRKRLRQQALAARALADLDRHTESCGWFALPAPSTQPEHPVQHAGDAGQHAGDAR
jgi:methylenetetrahydrofolate--tRNA-(uracil-5-)-methyltransferase